MFFSFPSLDNPFFLRSLVQLITISMNSDIEELLTLEQVAKILKVEPQTLRRWDRQGVLKAVRVGTRRGVGDRRYRKQDIETYISRHNKK